jgi:hypothetical protein
MLLELPWQHFFISYLTNTSVCTLLVKSNPQVSQIVSSSFFLSEWPMSCQVCLVVYKSSYRVSSATWDLRRIRWYWDWLFFHCFSFPLWFIITSLFHVPLFIVWELGNGPFRVRWFNNWISPHPKKPVYTSRSVAYPGIFSSEREFNKFSWGQRAERTGSGDGSPLVKGSAVFANEWNPILIRLLRMYFPQNWEFGSTVSKFRNFGGVEIPKPSPLGTPLKQVPQNFVLSWTLLCPFF